jgi:stage II sporulation protein D
MQAILVGGRVGLMAVVVFAVIAPVRALADPACDTTIRVLLERRESAFGLVSEGRPHSFELSPSGEFRTNGRRQKSWRSREGQARLAGQRVPGVLSVVPLGGSLALIAEIPLETYVAGVLKGEVPAFWKAHALQAQAVVSRSYALHQRAVNSKRAYDVEANTRHQVFKLGPLLKPVARAVEETRCEVLTWRGAPILAAFHSASGGRTASAQEVWGKHLAYLKSTEVKGEEDSPDTYWREAVSRTTMSELLEAVGLGIGDVWAAQVLARSESGRVLKLRFIGSGGETRLSGGRLRSVLGESALKSTLFELSVRDGAFVFVGSGRGHGVGMSQWGAQGMARRGAVYTDILQSFYPGTKLKRWRGELGDPEEFAGR